VHQPTPTIQYSNKENIVIAERFDLRLCHEKEIGIAVDRYPPRDYQNVIRALSCMVRIGTEVLEICDVPVEIADPVRLRPLAGNPKFA
jgi:hypothetical protein